MAPRCAAAVRELLFAPGDGEDIKKRKLVCFLFIVVAMCAIVSQMAATAFAHGWWSAGYELHWTWCLLSLGTGTITVTYMISTKRFEDAAWILFSVPTFASVALFDLHQASAMQSRVAPIFVLLIDTMLVGAMDYSAQLAFVSAVVVWLVVVEAELTFRFGLLDVWGTATVAQRREVACNCAAPPCGAHWSDTLRSFNVTWFVFLLDFFITRRFAVAVDEEQQRMRAVIRTTKDVAAALARFDLAAADQSLSAHGALLPAGLLESFETLVANLGSYKPYLPQACLPVEGDDEGLAWSESVSDFSAHEAPAPCHWGNACDHDSDSGASVSRRDSLGHSGAVRVNFLKNLNVSVLNVTGHIPHSACATTYLEVHEEFLAAVLTHVAGARGVVDAFLGNRVTASFNAARPSATHAKNAVLTAAALCDESAAVTRTGAVGTGAAAVGVLGTDTMRRQSIVGALPGMVDALERFGEVCRCGWVCNRLAYSECAAELPLRILVDRMVVTDGASDARGAEAQADRAAVGAAVYEISPKEPDQRALAPPPLGKARSEEWMYELECGAGRVYEAYNEAGALFLASGDADAALQKLAALGGSAAQGELLAAALFRARVVNMGPCIEARNKSAVVTSFRSPAE